MAVRGSNKRFSTDHEDHIANIFDGRRSPSSGASPLDKGDVRSKSNKLMFECKMTRAEKKPILYQQFEKVAKEAFEVGYEPAMGLRYYDPSSILSNRSGWVDLVLMRAETVAEFYE